MERRFIELWEIRDFDAPPLTLFTSRMPTTMAENDLDLYADDIDQDFAQVSLLIKYF